MEHLAPTAAEAAAGVPDHGIVRGTLDSGGAVRTRDFDIGTQIWAAYLDMAGVIEGVDFQLTPLDRDDGVLEQLDTFYPMQGEDKTNEVIFHYGWGQETATDFNYEPDGGPVINRALYLGQVFEGEPQRTALADQPESQLAFGIFSKTEGRPDIVEGSILAEIAQGDMAALGWPQDFFNFVPSLADGSGWTRVEGVPTRLPSKFGVGPEFGPSPTKHQFWLGDTIAVIARDQPALDDTFAGRVTDASFTEVDETGTVMPEIKCTPVISQTGITVSVDGVIETD